MGLQNFWSKADTETHARLKVVYRAEGIRIRTIGQSRATEVDHHISSVKSKEQAARGVVLEDPAELEHEVTLPFEP